MLTHVRFWMKNIHVSCTSGRRRPERRGRARRRGTRRSALCTTGLHSQALHPPTPTAALTALGPLPPKTTRARARGAYTICALLRLPGRAPPAGGSTRVHWNAAARRWASAPPLLSVPMAQSATSTSAKDLISRWAVNLSAARRLDALLCGMVCGHESARCAFVCVLSPQGRCPRLSNGPPLPRPRG